jgi:xanthine dehydrogenase accessory factor
VNQLGIWEFISDKLRKSQPVIFMCVVESKGSSPGRHGFKMAVSENDMYGSIGGGVMEHKFVELAFERLRNIQSKTIIRKQIHSKSAKKDHSGMICSGEQTIVLYALDNSNLEVIENILTSLHENKNGILVLSPDEFSFSETQNGPVCLFKMNSENVWLYKEMLGYMNHLYIIGGGHCSLALAKLMYDMNFYIHLIDDREGLNTFSQNDFVHEKKVVDDYKLLNEIVPAGDNVYVVIMTFGYRTDDIALRSLIKKEFKYLGVLGSQTKIEKMFEEWRRDNLPEKKLINIHAPIGLYISSQSPEEIAVSIAAEIISVKNKSQ